MKTYLGFVAVSLFLLSCTNTDRDNPYDMWGSNYMGNAFVEGSSSSVETGEPSSSSEEGFSSSSSIAPSSSSALPSSSSVVPSSSSNVGCAGFVNGTKRLHYEKEKEQFCDERDGKKYVYVKIGEQTWMAENLNYNASGSKCYGEDGQIVVGWKDGIPITTTLSPDEVRANCTKYGRLYDWATAMGLESSCNSSSCPVEAKHRGVCPAGWHIPSWRTESDVLLVAVDGPTAADGTANTAGTKLKAKSGWNNWVSGESANGTDDYGFSALPGGNGYSSGRFEYVGESGYLWLSTQAVAQQNGAINAYRLHVNRTSSTSAWYVNKTNLLSVRCVQD